MTEFDEQPVHIVAEAVPRFEPDDPALKDYLDANGYVVVKNVLNASDITASELLLWEYLNKSAGMKRDDTTTWTRENLSKIGLPDNGILCVGFAQSACMWNIRLKPRIKIAFSTIHETTDLIVSMDGGNIFLPWHRDDASLSMKTETGWYHVDQGTTMRGFQCVQGLVSLTDVTPSTGGLCLIPGSAACHNELLDLTRETDNFVEIPPTFHALNRKQILPLCQAGDMILWDSRTMHCSTPALEQPTQPIDQLLRVAAYICMTPKEWATKEVIQNRVQAYMREMSLHHWPHILTHPIGNDVADDMPIVKQYSDAPPEVKELVGLTQLPPRLIPDSSPP
jgi:ectoine hydroxylase-related dioxygenase (phytanoyl-CoA dioxygenase family)